MTIERTDAVIARVESVDYLAGKTVILVLPRGSNAVLPKPPYVVAQPAEGSDTQERFTAARATAHPRFVFHIVGATYQSVMKTYADVKAAFIDPVTKFPIPLEVAGETCQALAWDSPLPVQKDDNVTPPLIFATAEVSWMATPTS